MGQYDYLVPGNTATAPATTNRYASLIPKPAPMSADNPASLYNQANPAPDTSIFSNIKATVAGAISGFQNTPTIPKTPDLIAGVGENNALTAAHDAFTQGVSQISDHIVTVMDSKPFSLEQGVALGRAAVGTINTGFGVLLAPFAAYASVPVLGNIYDGVNKLFGAIGGAGGASLSKFVDQLPVSQDTKNTVMPLAQEAGSLIAQLAAGKIISDGSAGVKDTLTKISDNSKAILTELSNDPAIKDAVAKQTAPPVKVPVKSEATGEATPVPIETPATKAADYYKSQGYEPITPDSQLPTIDMGPKAKPTVPVIDVAAPKVPDLPGYKVEPLKPTVPAGRYDNLIPPKPTDAPVAPKTAVTATPEPKTPTIERPVAPDGTRPTKAANDINEQLVKQGMKQLTPEQMSKYTTGSYKDSAAQVAKMMTENLDAVKQMAKTGEGIPEGVHPQILFNSIEALATKNTDVGLLQALARSPLGVRLSEAGSTMGSHGFNDNPNSVVRHIQDIAKAREAAFKRRGADMAKEVSKIVKEGQKAIKKSASTRPTWEDFVKQLTCAIE